METDDSTFILRGKFSNLITVNVFGGILGLIILFIFSRIPNYGIPFFIVATPLLVIWMVGDALVWRNRGVHELHISPTGIKVIRGFKRVESMVLPGQITDMRCNKKGARMSINIMLGQKVQDVPGVITLFPGKRIYLTSDAFNDKEFEKAIDLLEKLLKKE